MEVLEAFTISDVGEQYAACGLHHNTRQSDTQAVVIFDFHPVMYNIDSIKAVHTIAK
jgi:hypothetical protein